MLDCFLDLFQPEHMCQCSYLPDCLLASSYSPLLMVIELHIHHHKTTAFPFPITYFTMIQIFTVIALKPGSPRHVVVCVLSHVADFAGIQLGDFVIWELVGYG
eukprot:UN27155